MGEPNWAELGVFISVCGSAVVALIFAMQKSSCDQECRVPRTSSLAAAPRPVCKTR